MDIKITISTDNAAFDGVPGDEVSSILLGLATGIEYIIEQGGMNIRDANGNTVGKMEVTE